MFFPRQSSIIPLSEGVSPQKIRDDEELQRLAGLQLRDSLVRGLGVSEQLQSILDDRDSERADTAMSTRPQSTNSNPAKSLFFTNTVFHDSGVGTSLSHSSFPSEHSHTYGTTDSTLLHTLPGSTSSHYPQRRAYGPGSKFQMKHPSLSGGYPR